MYQPREGASTLCGEGRSYLHGNKLRPPILLCTILHHSELICPHGTSSDIPDLAASDQVIKSLHRLFNRSVGVKAMNPEYINIVSLEPFQRRVHGLKEGTARKIC